MGSLSKKIHHHHHHHHHYLQQSTSSPKPPPPKPGRSPLTNNSRTMSLSLLQQCTKVVNYLISFQESAPFILPMTPPPPFSKIKRPMDFTTLERNLYSQQYYSTYSQFDSDLVLIWENALIIYNKDINHLIYKNALALQRYYQQMDDIGHDRLPSSSNAVEVSTPRSTSASPQTSDNNNSSNSISVRDFYMTLTDLQPQQPLDMNDLNAPLFRFLQRSSTPATTLPYPRLYIRHQRKTLKQATKRSKYSPSTTTSAILWNTNIEPLAASSSYCLVTTNITLMTPLGLVHRVQSQDDTATATRDRNIAWVKINPHTTTTYRQVQCVIPEWMEQFYFKQHTPYTTHRLATNENNATAADAQEWMDRWINCLSTGKSWLHVPEIISNTKTSTMINDDDDDEQYTNDMTAYREHTMALFNDLKKYAQSKDVPIVNIQKYLSQTTDHANAEGYFKQVRYVNNNNNLVVQTFRRMTASQRTIELVGLLKLKGKKHMADILEVLETTTTTADEKVPMGGISGLSMQRYQQTLKQYTHRRTHHRLTAYQKMDLIQQMLECLQVIHEHGIAHRDLSEVNFMVDERPDKLLDDGSKGADVYLIDFGKAVFTKPRDARRWWIEPVPKKQQATTTTATVAATTTTTMDGGSTKDDDYEGEVIPKTRQELDKWCEHLPLIYVKPDHGYRLYRSIQTLPRNRVDHDILPWLVDPMAEDMYSIGALIWKVFADTEPWHGILDNDLKGLRERVEDDEQLEKHIGKEVAGDVSRQLLLLCLKAQPNDRISATNLLAWIQNNTTSLLEEWDLHAPMERKRRHKTSFKFEDEQARHRQQIIDKRNNKRQKLKMEEKQRKIEEKEKQKVERQRKKEEARVQQLRQKEWELQQQQQLQWQQQWHQHFQQQQQQQWYQQHYIQQQQQRQQQQQQQQPLPPIPDRFLPTNPDQIQSQSPMPSNGYFGYSGYAYPTQINQPDGKPHPYMYQHRPPQPNTYIPPTPSSASSSLPAPSFGPQHIRFRPVNSSNPLDRTPYQARPAPHVRTDNNNNTQSNPLPSPTSPNSSPTTTTTKKKSKYIPTGRPVGRPVGWRKPIDGAEAKPRPPSRPVGRPKGSKTKRKLHDDDDQESTTETNLNNNNEKPAKQRKLNEYLIFDPEFQQ